MTPTPADENSSSPNHAPKSGLVMGILLGVFILGTISTCSRRHTGSAPTAPDTFTYRAAAEKLVEQHLRDPSSAEFSEMRVIPSGPGKSTMVCGKVNAKNGFGGMTGPKRFVVGGTVVLEDEVGADMMSQVWRELC